MHTYMCNCYLIDDCDDSNKIIKSRYHDIQLPVFLCYPDFQNCVLMYAITSSRRMFHGSSDTRENYD
jgi:hypothetical protein